MEVADIRGHAVLFSCATVEVRLYFFISNRYLTDPHSLFYSIVTRSLPL